MIRNKLICALSEAMIIVKSGPEKDETGNIDLIESFSAKEFFDENSIENDIIKIIQQNQGNKILSLNNENYLENTEKKYRKNKEKFYKNTPKNIFLI